MSPKRTAPSRLASRGLAVLVSIAVAAVVGELALRALDPFGVSYYRDSTRYINEAIMLLPAEDITPSSRIFQNRPGLHLEFETFEYATDELGLRVAAPDEPAGPEPRGRPRILFLGDSVTFAWGVDDHESWIRILERTTVGPSGLAPTGLNAGHLQYNTVQQADLFESAAEALRPDAVVVTFVTNDLTDEPFEAFTRLMEAIASAEVETGPAAELGRLWTRTKAWFWAVRGVLEFRRLSAEEAGPAPEPGSIEDQPGYEEGWERCRSGFERILAQARALGVPLLVLDHGKPRIPAVREWCEANGVPWYDFTFTDEEWARGVRLSKADAHANALGNQLLADKARRALVAEGWLRASEAGGE